MRNAIVMLTAALTLVTGRLGAQGHTSQPPDVGPGRIAWFDLTTTDLARSKDFYSKLLGWHFAAVQGGDLAVEINAGGTAIGTLRVAEGAVSPFNGVVYVQVADMRASCGKVTELAGTVAPGFPFNLPGDAGAVAIVLDPTGHPLGLYSKTPLPADGGAR